MLMRRSLLLVALLGLAVGLIVLLIRHDSGTVGSLSTHDFASLVMKIAMLVVIGGAVLTLFRDRFSDAVQNAMLWVVIALALVLGYTYRFDIRDVSDRVFAELVPGRAAVHGHAVEFARSRSGDFAIAAEVNGNRVAMILDTGASTVVLTNEAAKAAGLPINMMKYSVNVETANGRALTAAVTLDRVMVGNITEHAVSALIAQPGQLKTSLLGMSFLNRLAGWEVRGDKLMMRGYQ
jgi:aspartyl protease family protein